MLVMQSSVLVQVMTLGILISVPPSLVTTPQLHVSQKVKGNVLNLTSLLSDKRIYFHYVKAYSTTP